LTSCRWQTFTPPLSTLLGSLNGKDGRFDNTPTPTTAEHKRADGITSISERAVQVIF
jgi:hypothetical protein